MQKLIATKSFTYATRRLLPGESFDASDKDSRLLIAIKKAKADRVPGKIAPPPQNLVQQIVSDSNDDTTLNDISNLRAEYESVIGKRPFNGWDAAALREKIDAAK